MLFQKNDTVLFIGDSISDYERKRPVGEGLRNAWGTSYVACTGALLGSVYPELALRVINMGVSGNQTRDLIARWQTDVMDLRPDWVCMLIGINDVWRQFDQPQMPETHVLPDEYARNCESLIQRTLPHVKGSHARADGRVRRGHPRSGRKVPPALHRSASCLGWAVPAHASLQHCLGSRASQPDGLHVHCPPAAKRRGL